MSVFEVSKNKLIELSDDFLLQLCIWDAEPLAIVHENDTVVIFNFLDLSTVVTHLLKIDLFFGCVSDLFTFAFTFSDKMVALDIESEKATVALHVLK